ncbi:MAG: hypothetical protein IT328_02590 [Caldilineaceae bacterium]|nr:hypothetical protein [Caldilineaceae bacterium]
MNRFSASQPNASKGKQYQIRIGQHLDLECSAWLAGLAITNLEGGEAILSGLLVDQAALYGVLVSLRDLNVTLLELRSGA